MKAPSVKPVRCAIYTRVSTEHGLDQEFNSLDAQYEAASAYIKSQSHAGWTLIRYRYDDGGYSGGPTDRPDLQKLLDDNHRQRPLHARELQRSAGKDDHLARLPRPQSCQSSRRRPPAPRHRHRAAARSVDRMEPTVRGAWTQSGIAAAPAQRSRIAAAQNPEYGFDRARTSRSTTAAGNGIY